MLNRYVWVYIHYWTEASLISIAETQESCSMELPEDAMFAHNCSQNCC